MDKVGLWCGIFFLSFGLIMLFSKKLSVDSRIIRFVLFFLFGAMGIIGYITKNTPYILTGTLLPMSLVLMWMCIHMKLLTIRCNKQIPAKYISSIYRGKTTGGSIKCSPIFRYTFEGKEYEEAAWDSYRSEFNLIFKEDEAYDLPFDPNYEEGTYTIYIDPNNPEKCLYDNEVDSSYYGNGILGLAFFIFYIYVMYIQYLQL